MTLDDDAVKIILSTKGTMDDVSPEMKRILDYIDGKGASDYNVPYKVDTTRRRDCLKC